MMGIIFLYTFFTICVSSLGNIDFRLNNFYSNLSRKKLDIKNIIKYVYTRSSDSIF